MIFDPGITTLDDFTDYVEANRAKPCRQAVAWLRTRDWTNVDEAPFEFAYHLLLEFRDVQGPIFRAGTIERVGQDPFWAARAWMTVPGLTTEEYAYLMVRWWYRYPDMRKRAEDGSLGPGSRAIVVPTAGRGRS